MHFLQVGDPPGPATRVGQPDATAATRLGTAVALRGGNELGGTLEVAADGLGRGRALSLFIRFLTYKTKPKMVYIDFCGL